MKHLMTTMATAAVCALGAPAGADMVDFVSHSAASTEGLGSYVGSLDWTWDGASLFGTLDVSITNTTDVSIGGFLVALAFEPSHIASGATATLASADDASFLNFASPQDASPFGMYSAGAGLEASFHGGGNPSDGLGIGETGNFSFTVTALAAADLASVSAADFLGSLDDHPFIVRFRGMADGTAGSDKVPAMIPGAASIALLGFGGLVRRRRG